MAGAIGIRVYRVSVHNRGSQVPINDPALKVGVSKFISRFVSDHSKIFQNDEFERAWFLEPKESDLGCSSGLIRYGTYGFESNIIDGNTGTEKYHRKLTDIEQIPLFYEFWCPIVSSFGFAVFQSFEGRSCVAMLTKQMKSEFEQINKGYILAFKKVMPDDAKGSVLGSAPVVRLRLIRKGASGDVVERYFHENAPQSVNLELIVKARRNGKLGKLEALFSTFKPGAESVLMYEGIQFERVSAEIRVGKRLRKIGVYGSEEDSGLIDLTDEIEKGVDGHPKFEAIREESKRLIDDFYNVMRGMKDEN